MQRRGTMTALAGALLAFAGALAAGSAGAQVVVVQPAPRVVVPAPSRAWVPGHWEGWGHGRVWVQGHWVTSAPGYAAAGPQRGWQQDRNWEHVARRDIDRDGIPNQVDRDRDGDGVPNVRDRRPDNARRF